MPCLPKLQAAHSHCILAAQPYGPLPAVLADQAGPVPQVTGLRAQQGGVQGLAGAPEAHGQPPPRHPSLHGRHHSGLLARLVHLR